MSRYHISRYGEPAICKAQSDARCPRGGEHFATEDEAAYYVELRGGSAAVAEVQSFIQDGRQHGVASPPESSLTFVQDDRQHISAPREERAPTWLDDLAREAAAHLEASPASMQPHWWRTQGRAAAARRGNLPPLPAIGPDGDLRDSVPRPSASDRLDGYIMAQQPGERLRAAMARATRKADDGKYMEPADNVYIIYPNVRLMREELLTRLTRAEQLLLEHRSSPPAQTDTGELRRLQAKAAGVQYIRREWAPRIAGAESPEEIRAHLRELRRQRENYPGYNAYRNEPGFREGLELAIGYVEEYLRLS